MALSRSSHSPAQIETPHKYGSGEQVKTTLEIPDHIFRSAKSAAVERGIPLREFVTEAIKEKLAADPRTGTKSWVKHIGKLQHPHRESERTTRLVEEDSEKIDV